MKTTANRSCPKCGAAIAPGSMQGLCPNCLAMVGFGADPASVPTVTPSAAVSPDAKASAAQPLISPALSYFGDYELQDEIARGGMGVVYRARQVSLNRTVALKMILTGKFATDADVKRFRTEAEAAANLQHPNIVAIHEVGQHEGRHYFSMDYVEGRNLAQVIGKVPMPPANAAALLKTIAEAVHYAHQRGTLHRDLKPHNVLIDAAGNPRITDFGLARRIEQASDLTQEGSMLGSPSYMPPEQATGRQAEIGPASDVYSLGAILYQMLTGTAPFIGATVVDTLRQVVEQEPVAPSKCGDQVPSDLETICLKCLEKKPERRYASARALAEELGRFLNHEPILARPASAWRKAWSWSQRNPWAIIGLASAVGIVLLGLAYGLWERVKYLEGGANPQLRHPIAGMELIAFANLLILIPGLLFGRWLKSRRQRNLPVTNRQLALLAGIGLLLIVIGLWSDLMFIRDYVWKRPFFDSKAAVVGWCLGIPLLFCWVGGIMIWQAIRRQQAHWSGSTTVEEEWLPRQALHYSTVAYTLATFANLVLFVSAAQLGIAMGWFDRALNVVGSARDGKILLSTCFTMIAFGISMACWVYATRKLYKRPPLVSIFLGVLLLGAMIAWFSAPPYSLLPPTFVFASMLAGLAGGWVLVKWVGIRKEKPAEPLRPLVLGELFQCDRRAFVIGLGVVATVLGSLAGLLFRKGMNVGEILGLLQLAVLNVLWPAILMAVRTTTGKVRELFLSILVGVTMLAFVVPVAVFALPFAQRPGVKVTLFLGWLAITLIGNAAGCALIYFGKLRMRGA